MKHLLLVACDPDVGHLNSSDRRLFLATNVLTTWAEVMCTVKRNVLLLMLLFIVDYGV